MATRRMIVTRSSGPSSKDERRRSRLDRVEQGVLVLVDGEHDDPRRGQLALDPLGRLDATGRRQRRSHEDDVGDVLERAIDRTGESLASPTISKFDGRWPSVLAVDPDRVMALVDDQDPCRPPDSAIGITPSPIRAAVLVVAHSFSFADDRAFVGIASRTTVPPSAVGDRYVEASPINSGLVLAPIGVPVPPPTGDDGADIVSVAIVEDLDDHAASVCCVRTTTVAALACLRTFWRASCVTRSATVRCRSSSPSDEAREIQLDGDVGARPELFGRLADGRVESGVSSGGGRSWLRNPRTLPSRA